MKTVKIAVVGAGNRAMAHLATIPKLTDIYQLTAICDINAERAKEVSEQFKVSGYTDVERMLKAEKPDVVLIAVRRDGHHTIAKIAMEYGAHCITETPIASTLACADIMINAAKKNNLKLEVAENVWRWPHERMKRVIVDSGLIGELRFAKLWYASGSYHGMNAIRTLIQSEVKFVVGYKPKGPNSPSEIGIIEFENGVSVLYELPFRPRRNHWEIDGTKGFIVGNEVLVDGESYSIQTITEKLNGKKTITSCRLETDPPLVWENRLAKYGLNNADDVARAASHYSIYKAIVEDTEPEYGALNARKDLEILIAIRESALKDSVPIKLPLTEITEHEKQLHEEYKAKYGHNPLDVRSNEARSAVYSLRR